MRYIIYKISAPVFIILLLSGCTKDEEDHFPLMKQIPTFMEYLNFGNSNYNGYIALQSYKGFGTDDFSDDNAVYKAKARVMSKDGRYLNLGALSIGDISLTADNNNHYDLLTSDFGRHATRHLYGRDIALGFSGPGTLSARDGEQTMYIPMPLEISKPDWDISGNNVLAGNPVIEWNADAENDKGVIVLVEFNPNNVDNRETFGANHTPVKHILVTEDDGKYTLQLNKIERIPKGAIIRLSLIRANFTIFELTEAGEDLDIAAYAYTNASARFEMK